MDTSKTYVIAPTEMPGVTFVVSRTQQNVVTTLAYVADDAQFWQLQDAGSGAYAIVNRDHDVFVDCDAQGNVRANPKNQQSPDSQAWFFELLDNGLYAIRNKATQCALSTRDDSGEVYTGVPNAAATNQQWAMLDSAFISAVPVDVPCALTPQILPEQVVDITGTQGLHLSAYRGTGTQLWMIRAAGQGCYAIVNHANGLVFESDTAHNVFAKPQISATQPGSANQRWAFDNLKTGEWWIVNQGTGYYLQAAAPDNVSGQQAASSQGSETQQLWQIVTSYVKTDLVALGQLYSNGWNATINSAPCAEYVSSDSNYRSKQPTWTQNSDGGGTAVMLLDHIRGGGMEQDDHATLTVTFLSTGQLYSANLEWSLGGQWAIEWGTTVVVKIEDEVDDYASEQAGDAAAEMADLLSEGALTPLDPVISKAASEMTSKLIGSLFSQLNGMLAKEIGHDDGGRQTFIAVINHNMNKLCASMSVTPALALPNIGIDFSVADFPTTLFNNLKLAYGNSIAESSVSWDGDQTTEYYVAGDTADGNHQFSTWKHDSSAYPLKQGLYVSTKIDMIHGSAAKDGHYVVMLGFSSNGQVISAQAALEFPPDSNVDSYLSPVFTGTDANAQLYQDLVTNKPDFAAPNAVKLNMDSMIQCVRVTTG